MYKRHPPVFLSQTAFSGVDGYCKYHNGVVEFYHTGTVSCCKVVAEKGAYNKRVVPSGGCAKGKHRSKHHSEYLYTNYLLNMYYLVSCLRLIDDPVNHCSSIIVRRSGENVAQDGYF